MKKTLSLVAVLMVVGVAATPAQAAKHYVSGFGGISWMQNLKTSDTYTFAAPESNFTSDNDLGSGLALTGAIGCDYGSYRLEAEVGYQTNDVKSIALFDNGAANNDFYSGTAGTPTNRADMRGDVSVLSLMGNGYYDIDLGGKVEFYATAGVGVAQVSLHNVNRANSVVRTGDGDQTPYTYTYPATTDPGYNGHETTLAWQVGAGIAAPIADNVKLDLRYRYFATTDFTLDGLGSGAAAHSGGNTNSANTNLSSHSVLLGLRVDF